MDDKQKNLRSLTFVVNGQETTIKKVNIKAPLKVAVEKALKETGNTGRPLEDWIVKYNDADVDINQPVESFNFPDDAVIFVILRSAVGGNEKPNC